MSTEIDKMMFKFLSIFAVITFSCIAVVAWADAYKNVKHTEECEAFIYGVNDAAHGKEEKESAFGNLRLDMKYLEGYRRVKYKDDPKLRGA